jgi:hypothetical protein
MILMMRCGGLPKVRTVAMSDGLMVWEVEERSSNLKWEGVDKQTFHV